MTRARRAAPLLSGGVFLCDGGLETTFLFHEGVDLPHFATFPLLESAEGRARLSAYFERYLALAEARRVGFLADTVTWRANPDWGAKLGYDAAGLARINREAVAFVRALVRGRGAADAPILVNGVVGPRGDGYRAGRAGAEEARAYHAPQIATLAQAGVDLVTAMTLSTVDEAIGIARAAEDADVACAVSFTVETDGRLADGTPLAAAIATTDDATAAAPIYYMVNCAHPAHFADVLAGGGRWVERIRGVRANASTKSHAELDESDTLDEGDPVDLGRRTRALRAALPRLSVFGGCCGTDHRHIEAICDACLEPA